MANTPKKPKGRTQGTSKTPSVTQQKLTTHYQALAAHANALTAHALALSAHAQALQAAGAADLIAPPSGQTAACVYNCLHSIAPEAEITDNTFLSKIPLSPQDLVALGECINGCVPLHDPNCWGGGVDIDGGWRVSVLINQTEHLRTKA